MSAIPAKYAELVLAHTKDQSYDDLLIGAIDACLQPFGPALDDLANYHGCTVGQLVKAMIILSICEAEEQGHIHHALAGKPLIS